MFKKIWMYIIVFIFSLLIINTTLISNSVGAKASKKDANLMKQAEILANQDYENRKNLIYELLLYLDETSTDLSLDAIEDNCITNDCKGNSLGDCRSACTDNCGGDATKERSCRTKCATNCPVSPSGFDNEIEIQGY